MKTTERAQLIRNAKRCLADLCGGHVWGWTVERCRQEADYVLAVRGDVIAEDERLTLKVLAAEYKGVQK